MVGMIFAAGIGSRLKPWTDAHPKALVPVGGVPMLGRVVQKLTDAGVSRIVVNVHHFAQQVVDYLNDLDCSVPILISDETDKLLDTGGGLAKALPLIGDEAVLIHNADILETVDMSDLIASHQASAADATLLVDPRVTTRRLIFTEADRLKGWTNVDTHEFRPATASLGPSDRLRAFDGVHLVSPTLYPLLRQYASTRDKFSIIDFYLHCAAQRLVMGFDIPATARWFDVGRPETLLKANDFISNS